MEQKHQAEKEKNIRIYFIQIKGALGMADLEIAAPITCYFMLIITVQIWIRSNII